MWAGQQKEKRIKETVTEKQCSNKNMSTVFSNDCMKYTNEKTQFGRMDQKKLYLTYKKYI